MNDLVMRKGINKLCAVTRVTLTVFQTLVFPPSQASPVFCSLVCVQYNTQKRNSGEKWERPGNTYYVNDVRWTQGGCEGDVGGEGSTFEITY